MNEDSSLARKTTASATSRGLAKRFWSCCLGGAVDADHRQRHEATIEELLMIDPPPTFRISGAMRSMLDMTPDGRGSGSDFPKVDYR
jgi:hypothetical protein